MTQEFLHYLLKTRFQLGFGYGFAAGMFLGAFIAVAVFSLNWPR